MITDHTNILNSPVRNIGARVELYENSALADTYNQYYALKSFSVERMGEVSKFFGFGICQKLNMKLVDKDRQIHITTIDSCKPYLTTGGGYINSFPEFFVTEVHRDENTNELSITAYDALYKATAHSISELELTTPYTIEDFAAAIAAFLGVTLVKINIGESETCFSTSYEEGANFEGTETIREALNAIAEATQTIYYLTETELVFKRLDIAGDAVLTITKEDYITLDSGTNRRLATITHVTELEDNVTVSTTESGTTQFMRDNPFLDLREDIDTLLNNALAAIGGITINQFACTWRGNFLLEIGDKIALITKDNETVISYFLDDVLTYDGGLTQKTKWNFEDHDTETATNPASLGDALKLTFARVDKANQEIELVASNTNDSISSILLDAESITASVQSLEKNVNDALGGINSTVEEIVKKVETTVTSEDLTIAIQSELANGVDKVTTSTGFTFNEEGLTVSKDDSEMSTQITEDGMTVSRNDTVVLTANNTGVEAINLHATTYLSIGTNSRFEDYAGNRTGCFYIGG